MAKLKQIKFGTFSTPIAKTVVQGKPEGVIAVTNTKDYTNSLAEDKDYSYDIDVNVDNSTIVKSEGKLAVGTVPAAKVSVAAGTGLTSSDAQAAFKELKDKIDTVEGAAKSYTIVKKTEGITDENVKEQYLLQQTVGSTTEFVGAPINIYKDSSLKSVALDGQNLVFTYILANGKESVVRLDVSTFLAESEFADGLIVENHVVKVKVDTASEGFLTVGENGVKLSGVQTAINAAVEALDVDDAAVAGQYVSAVSETDGVISVERLNVADAVLNGYAKGEKPASTVIGAGDDVKGAIAKLEHQVDDAKAAATAAAKAATTKVVKGTDAGNNLEIASAKETDGSTTYTINLSDVASKTALDAEIAAREAADTKLTQDLQAEVERAKLAETSIDSVVGLTKAVDGETRTYTNEGEYIGKAGTNTVASDIKALDTKLKKVADDLAGVQYQVSGTTLEFFGINPKA